MIYGIRNTATGQVEQVFPPDDFGGKGKAEKAAQDVGDAVERQVRELSAAPGAGLAHIDTPVGYELVELPDDFGQPPPEPEIPEDFEPPPSIEELEKRIAALEKKLNAKSK